MNIVKLALLDTGTYDQMYLRPYEVNDSARNLATIREATNGGANITNTTLSGVAGQVLRPQTAPMAPVAIANGWNNRRYRFFMEISEPDLTGTETIQYLTGFTDHTGVSAGGHVDPNMRFFVSTAIQMKTIVYATPAGRVNQSAVADASHVFNFNLVPGVNFHAGMDTINLQRPMDVCGAIQTSQYRRASDEFFDPRSTFVQENVKLSRRENSVAPSYLSQVLTSGIGAYSNANENSTEVEIWGSAAGYAREGAYSQNNALFELHRQTSFQEGDSFTFAELQRLCPHLEQVTKYLPVTTMSQQQGMVGPTPFVGTYEAGQNDGWQGQNIETIWATILSNAVPAVMLECMLKECFFTVHDHTLDGSIDVRFQSVVPLGRHLNGPRLAEQFAFRLKNEIIRDLKGGNPAPFSITGMFDIIGESRLTIQVGSGFPIPFATPTFADNLFMPVITIGQRGLDKIADSVDFFTSNLLPDCQSGGYQPPVPQPISAPTQLGPISNESSYVL